MMVVWPIGPWPEQQPIRRMSWRCLPMLIVIVLSAAWLAGQQLVWLPAPWIAGPLPVRVSHGRKGTRNMVCWRWQKWLWSRHGGPGRLAAWSPGVMWLRLTQWLGSGLAVTVALAVQLLVASVLQLTGLPSGGLITFCVALLALSWFVIPGHSRWWWFGWWAITHVGWRRMRLLGWLETVGLLALLMPVLPGETWRELILMALAGLLCGTSLGWGPALAVVANRHLGRHRHRHTALA